MTQHVETENIVGTTLLNHILFPVETPYPGREEKNDSINLEKMRPKKTLQEQSKQPEEATFKSLRQTECNTDHKFQKNSSDNTKSKPEFACRYCGKTFTRNYYRTVHERTHTNTKPFQCNYCEMCFKDASLRKSHERKHTKEKPFCCDVCGRTFSYRPALKLHEKTHQEKAFECKECGKRFAINSSLRRHLRVHTGEKPYKCKICDKSYSHHHALRRHERWHRGERPFQCPYCDENFIDKACYNRHLTRKHFKEIWNNITVVTVIKDDEEPEDAIETVELTVENEVVQSCAVNDENDSHVIHGTGYGLEKPISTAHS